LGFLQAGSLKNGRYSHTSKGMPVVSISLSAQISASGSLKNSRKPTPANLLHVKWMIQTSLQTLNTLDVRTKVLTMKTKKYWEILLQNFPFHQP
jgi:hypothetical protein